MTSGRLLAASAVFGVAICGIATAVAAMSTTVEIDGVAPVACSVQFAPGGPGIGRLNEFCNDSAGYDVWVSHSADLSGATLYVDGRAIVLEDGDTLISSSAGAAKRSESLSLSSAGSGGGLSFRIAAR